MSDLSEPYVCPTCHHTSTAHWVRITPGLINTLLKVRAEVSRTHENVVNVSDIGLTTTERMNFSKLRQHGLVAKYKEDGYHVRGLWLLTKRGAQFLRGEISIPLRVKTLNNHVEERDTVYVYATDVVETMPYFEGFDGMERERQPLELRQLALL